MTRYPAYQIESHRIGAGGTVRIKKKVYSVPSRLKGFRVSCRIYADRIDLHLGPQRIYSLERARGGESGIKWADLVGWLVRKPGAFAHYRYRDAMFPTSAHRELCDALHARFEPYAGDREYLLILNASAALEPDAVQVALGRLVSGEATLSLEGFREVAGLERPVADLAPFEPDLSVYRMFDEELKNDDEQPGNVSEELPPADDGDHGRGGSEER
jgi:hypothetical protein